MYNRVTQLYSRNSHIVNQLHFNKKVKKKRKMSAEKKEAQPKS